MPCLCCVRGLIAHFRYENCADLLAPLQACFDTVAVQAQMRTDGVFRMDGVWECALVSSPCQPSCCPHWLSSVEQKQCVCGCPLPRPCFNRTRVDSDYCRGPCLPFGEWHASSKLKADGLNHTSRPHFGIPSSENKVRARFDTTNEFAKTKHLIWPVGGERFVSFHERSCGLKSTATAPVMTRFLVPHAMLKRLLHRHPHRQCKCVCQSHRV
jgi:hypothetical protein